MPPSRSPRPGPPVFANEPCQVERDEHQRRKTQLRRGSPSGSQPCDNGGCYVGQNSRARGQIFEKENDCREGKGGAGRAKPADVVGAAEPFSGLGLRPEPSDGGSFAVRKDRIQNPPCRGFARVRAYGNSLARLAHFVRSVADKSFYTSDSLMRASGAPRHAAIQATPFPSVRSCYSDILVAG